MMYTFFFLFLGSTGVIWMGESEGRDRSITNQDIDITSTTKKECDIGNRVQEFKYEMYIHSASIRVQVWDIHSFCFQEFMNFVLYIHVYPCVFQNLCVPHCEWEAIDLDALEVMSWYSVPHEKILALLPQCFHYWPV